MMMLTAKMINKIPIASCSVKGSPNTKIPTNTAVTGSVAPNTAVSVPPICFTASTNARFESTVGIMAKANRLKNAGVEGMG